MSCDVLIVSNLYPPVQIGGYEIAARDVADGLRDNNVEVMVLTSDYKKNELKRPDPLVLRDLKLASSWFGDYPIHNAKKNMKYNYEKTLEVIERTKPKVLYAWNQANLGYGVLAAAKKSNIPILHHVMGYDLLSYRDVNLSLRNKLSGCLKCLTSSRSILYAPKKQHLKNIIFLSRFMQDYYKKCGVFPGFSSVVYPGIAVKRVKVKSNYQPSNNAIHVVYVGQLASHKGVKEIKLSLNKVKQHIPDCDIHLTLCGDGEQNFVSDLLAESNIPIHHRGFMNRDLLYDDLYNYDIGIFSSTWQEPFGIAQIEMMAAGLPILSSATGGAAEPLKHDHNAVVFNPQDRHDLTNKIITLINQYNTRAAMLGKNARQTIEDYFSDTMMNQEIYRIIDHILCEPCAYL